MLKRMTAVVAVRIKKLPAIFISRFFPVYIFNRLYA